jgi:hypothetical protein
MTVSDRKAPLAALAFAALIALSGCAGASPEPEGEAPAPEETEVAESPETACPDGFVDAYAAASLPQFAEGATFTEVSAAEFEPAFLAEFLDGGCAIHVTGTSIVGGFDFPVDVDFGFTTENVSAEIAAVLEGEGYKDDGSGFNFTREDPLGFAQVVNPTADFHTTGDAAVQEFYSGGTVFNAS